MLKIGVDARLLSEPHTGIGRYLFEVLSRLVLMGHDWYLYSHRPLSNGEWIRDNVTIRTCAFHSRIMRMIWAQTVLPLLVKKDGIDIFWGPSHRIPYFLDRRVNAVLTVHDLVWRHAGYTMRPLSRYLDSKLMPFAITRANSIMTVSSHTAKDVEMEFPGSSGKIFSTPLGGSFLERKQSLITLSELRINEPFFLFVGTLEPRKNLARLLEAYANLPDQLRNQCKLVIAGGKGWGSVDLKKLIFDYKLSNRVLVLGYVNDELLALLYKKALFLALPSLYEGFGLPILEALSVGTPVLTSNCSSMPEVAGDAAILIDPYSVDSIKLGIQTLLNDHRLRIKLSEIAIKQSSLFSWDKTADLTFAVFQKLIEKN